MIQQHLIQHDQLYTIQWGVLWLLGGAYYEIENNPSYNQKKEPSRDFQYIVGIYYTNLN